MPPGVQFPDVVDLVALHPEGDAVRLVMIEERPWDGSAERLRELQAKIIKYVSFALDGQFADTYPSYVGKPITIQLSCFEEPDQATKQFLDDMRSRLQRYAMPLEIKLIEKREF